LICTRRAPRFNHALLPFPDPDRSVIRVDGCVAAWTRIKSKSVRHIDGTRHLPDLSITASGARSGSGHEKLPQANSSYIQFGAAIAWPGKRFRADAGATAAGRDNRPD
jgi:hypothetical protein